MTIEYQRLKNWPFEDVVQRYTFKDSILYALGVGLGENPVDPQELKFLYEDGLKALPTIAVVLSRPGFWVRDPRSGVDWKKVLHGEQGLILHRPLPPEGEVSARTKIYEIVDKGVGKGAILHLVKTLDDANTGTRLATVRSMLFLRGDGGCGSFGNVPIEANALPEQTPSQIKDIATLPQSALIYRLSGDYNPIHADPEAAARAGFERPILHGLCTLGIATRAVLEALADGMPDRLSSLSARFSRPVFPGETIRTELITTGDQLRFRSRVIERDVIVLDRGTVVLRN